MKSLMSRVSAAALLLLFTMILTHCDGNPSTEDLGLDRAAVRPTDAQVAKPLPADAAPPEKQVYRYLNYEPASLDISMTVYQSGQSEFAFERLCMLDHNNNLIPGAADRWESSEDGKTWTFYLHPDAKWSDGTPVTAHDFEYTKEDLLSCLSILASGSELVF